MSKESDYININRQLWNDKTDIHIASDFYDNKAFLNGKSTLKSIELDLLGDLTGKKVLHLQCHFGQDSLSMARMGAKVTGIDLSDKAIEKANEFAKQLNLEATFICCDIYDLPAKLDEQFDLVFSTYGTVGWLPDLTKWATIVAHFLKPNGTFVFAEFHPLIWMYDTNFKAVFYSYFNTGPIIEYEKGTYADRNAALEARSVSWNHPISEVLNSLLKSGLAINSFEEFDYSPYNCINETEEFEPGKFRIKHFENKIPMVYSLSATKK